jgi:hypothetical protein
MLLSELDISEPSEVIPRDLKGNGQWRMFLDKWARESEANWQTVVDCCSRDLIFWVDSFVWTFNPRDHPDYPLRPFITHDFQREALLEIDACIGRRNVIIPKSRYIGATWMVLLPLDRRLLFRRLQTFLLVSRNEDLVDKKGDPDSLFAKLDHIHAWLPPRMTASLDRNKLSLVNLANGSNIMGTSTTGNIGRGGRKTAVVADEFAFVDIGDQRRAWAAVVGNTNCAIVPSTPNGIGGQFYKLANDAHRKRVRLHWTDHPEQRTGAYRMTKNGPKCIDESFWAKAKVRYIRQRCGEVEIGGDDDDLARDHYPWGINGLGKSPIRSPYYDDSCLRIGVDSLIAQELDIDFLQSGSPFCDPGELETVKKRDCRSPFWQGELGYDGATFEFEDFIESPGGRLLLWLNLLDGRPQADRKYVAAADVSAGSEASHSCLSIYNDKMEKVARVKTNRLAPNRFAQYCYPILKWFHSPTIWFEMQGHGSTFADRLKELGYKNFYKYRDQRGKESKKIGWPSTADGKLVLLQQYIGALIRGRLVNRDEEAVDECGQYRWTDRGTVEHSLALGQSDPASAKKNHGDLVIADAGAWMLLKPFEKKNRVLTEDPEATKPQFCMAARMEEAEQEARRKKFW